MPVLTKLYWNILLRLNSLNEKEIDILLKDLELEFYALVLKYKFKDNRSISVLKALILEELNF